MNLFGLTNDPKARNVRFKLDASVQAELESYLTGQVARFSALTEEVPFDARYKPDEGEVLTIEGFDDLNGLLSAVSNPVSIPVAQENVLDLGTLKALYFGVPKAEGGFTIYIQHFDRRRLISTVGFSIFHGADSVYKKLDGAGLTIDNKICASLDGGKLRFCSFFHIRQIFDMTAYFEEATDSDIKEFTELEQIGGATLAELTEISDQWIRKKLWLVKQSQILQTVPIEKLLAAAMEFSIALESEEVDGVKKIKVPKTRAEFKVLLRFLDEDYYKSPLSNKSFLSNSKRAVS